MAMELLRGRYRDAVLGALVGRAAGATLGTDLRGQAGPHSVGTLDAGRGQAAASESLDAMLVSLAELEARGAELDAFHLALAWGRAIRYDVRAYGCAVHNLQRGLLPPTCGSFDNWFSGDASAMARSLIWGAVAPGSPQSAALMAYADATVDHSADGVWASVFWAACAAAGFVRSRTDELLKVGLAMVPAECRVARLVQLARRSRVEQDAILSTRALLKEEAGDVDPMDAALCSGYAAASLLYYGVGPEAVRWAVNCGGDTESAGAVVGGLVGIVCGATGLPADWHTAIGRYVVLGWGVPDVALPGTYDEVAGRLAAVAEALVTADRLQVRLVDELPVSAPAPMAAIAPTVAPPIVAAAAPPDMTAAIDGGSPGAGFALPDLDNAVPSVTVAEAGTQLPTDGLADTAVAGTVGNAEPEPPAPSLPDTAASGAAGVDPQASAPDGPQAGAPTSGEPVADLAVAPDPAPIVPDATPKPPEPVVAVPVAPVGLTTTELLANDQVSALWEQGWSVSTITSGHFEAIIDYGEQGPAVVPGSAQSVLVTLQNRGDAPWLGTVHMGVPSGWQVAVPGAQGERQMVVPGGRVRLGYAVRAPEDVPLPSANALSLNLVTEPGDEVSLPLALMAGSCWWFVGPFANIGDEGFYRSLEAETQPGLSRTYLGRSKGLIGWARMAFRQATMDIETMMSGRPGVAYGQTILHSARPATVRLAVATNDGARLWVNGAQVMQVHSHQPFCPERGQKRGVLVNLRPGNNSVMLKVIRCDAPLRISFAITNEDGTPRDDVRCVW